MVAAKEQDRSNQAESLDLVTHQTLNQPLVIIAKPKVVSPAPSAQNLDHFSKCNSLPQDYKLLLFNLLDLMIYVNSPLAMLKLKQVSYSPILDE